jgi:hypothetical protein
MAPFTDRIRFSFRPDTRFGVRHSWGFSRVRAFRAIESLYLYASMLHEAIHEEAAAIQPNAAAPPGVKCMLELRSHGLSALKEESEA